MVWGAGEGKNWSRETEVEEVCFVDFLSFSRDLKNFWLQDWYQTDIKNAAISGFLHGISSTHSKMHATTQSLKLRRKNYQALRVEATLLK